MSKHTPGPWKAMPRSSNFIDIQHSFGSVKGAITHSLCRLQARETWITEAEANARLIAAAPDLLEACQALICAWEGGHREDLPEHWMREAVAKATGEKV